MELTEALQRLTSGKFTDPDKAFWKEISTDQLYSLRSELTINRNALKDASAAQQKLFESLGRDGRKLRALAGEKFLEEWSGLSKAILRIELLTEERERVESLSSMEATRRAALVEFLVAQILRHKESTYNPRPEDEELWESIQGIQVP